MATWDQNYSFRGFLYIHKPAVVFKARIDAPDGYIFPTRELNFDGVTVGAYTDVEPGMTVYIGSTDGAYDLGRQRIKSSHPTNLQIGWSSLGVHDGEVKLPDNAYITVVDLRLVWSKIPYIQIADGAMFKDQDIGFVAADAQPPVANGGVGYAGFVDPITGVITVDFDSTNSYPVNPLSVLGSVLWDVKDGTITVGVDTDQIITATFPPGFRYVSLTVTDDGMRSHTCYIPVFAAEPTGANAPITDVEVTNHQLTVEGAKISFLVRQNIPTTTYPDGTLIIYWEDEWYNNVKGSINGYPGREHVKFVGFIHGEPTQVEAGELVTLAQVTLDCLDVAGKLATLPGFSQVVRRAASPTSWLEMQNANTDRYLHYLLHWHSNALELTDFYLSGSGDTYQFISFTSDGANLYSQVDGRAQATGTGFRLTSDSQGVMRVVPDPMFQESGDRTSNTQADFTESHLIRYGYSKQRPPRVHWTRTSALTTSGSELTLQNVVHSIAPGAAPGQGESSEVLGNRLVVSQAQANIFTGAAYERSNAPESMFDIEVANGGVQIEPAFMTWIRLSTTSRYAAQRGLIFTLERFLPANVSIARNSANGSKRVSFTAERELFGNIAATYIPPTANLPGYTEPSEYFGEILDTADTGFGGGTGNLAFFATDGYLYRTSSFSAPAPLWERLNLALDGVPTSFVVDAYSPLYLGTGSDVNGWIATHKNIYGIADIFGAATPTLQYTFNAETEQSIFEAQYWGANLASERGIQNLVACSLNYSGATGESGTSVVVTTDGSTWTEQNLDTESTVGGGVDPIAIIVSAKVPGMIYIAVITPASGGTLYKSLDYGATFSSTGVNITPAGNECSAMHLPFADNPTDSVLIVSRGTFPREIAILDGASFTDITPLNSASDPNEAYGLKAISTSPLDRNYIALIGQSATGVALYTSDDGGSTWTQRTEEMTYGDEWTGVEMLDNPAQLYVFGYEFIGYSADNGGGVLDKTGNIPDEFGAIGRVLSIVGG